MKRATFLPFGGYLFYIIGLFAPALHLLTRIVVPKVRRARGGARGSLIRRALRRAGLTLLLLANFEQISTVGPDRLQWPNRGPSFLVKRGSA